MMRFKEAFVIREDYGHNTGYGVAFADDESGQPLRLGVDFGEKATLREVAGYLKELAKKCEAMSLSEQLVRALEEGGKESDKEEEA